MKDLLSRAKCVALKEAGFEQELFDGDWCYTHGPDGDELRLAGRDGLANDIVLLFNYVKCPSVTDLKEWVIELGKKLWPDMGWSLIVETFTDDSMNVVIEDWYDNILADFDPGGGSTAIEIDALYELAMKLNEMEVE